MSRQVALVLFIQLLASQLLAAADPPTAADTSEVIVTATTENESLTSPSETKAAEQESQVPGGFTLRNTTEMERGRASNFEDLLQRSPGVFLQTDDGTEVNRISIRGSGILSEDEPLGVQFLLDGLTLNQGDGEAVLEDFDLATINYAEIYRGANAFKYGSITLGGAINLVTITGHDAAPFTIRLEGGSFGYFRGQITSGGVSGPFDYVSSLMGRYRDGFRDHSRDNTERFFGTLGYKIDDHLENRFYLTFDHVDRQLPGGLTKDEMNANPEQANEDAVAQDFNKKWEFVRLADKISYRNNGHEFDLGLFWFHRNTEERGFFEEDFREGITAFYSDNYGISANFVTHDDLFDRRNLFTVGFNLQVENEVSQNFENLDGHRGQTTALGTSASINAPFYLENQHYLTDKFSVILGMQAIYARRHFSDHFVTDDEGNQSHQQDFYGWNEKTGVVYEFDKQNQVFMNFSGSWQPPSFDNMVEFTEGTNSSVVYTPLHPQRAQTIEIGTRGERGRFEWELSLYHSWLHDELLELNDENGNEIGAINVKRSYHQGIEAGLDIELLDHGLQSKKERNPVNLESDLYAQRFSFRWRSGLRQQPDRRNPEAPLRSSNCSTPLPLVFMRDQTCNAIWRDIQSIRPILCSLIHTH